MQKAKDPYCGACGVCSVALFEAILMLLGKFFFCTAGGWENARSEHVHLKG
jgi:hypothetical protein